MTNSNTNADEDTAVPHIKPPARQLSPAAERALKEAEERRRASQDQTQNAPAEIGGRKGPEPTRYGDWEKKGIASDF